MFTDPGCTFNRCNGSPRAARSATTAISTSSLASSNCVTYSSEQLFAAVATDSIFATTTASGAAASGSGASGSRSGSGAGSTGTAGGSSSGGSASAAIESNVLPYLVIGFFSTVATMFTILA